MSNYEQPGERLSSTSHHYEHVYIGPGGRALVGNEYNISWFLADAKEEYHERLTGYRSRRLA
jgi:hypothetical protein